MTRRLGNEKTSISATLALCVIPACEPESMLQEMADQVRHDVAISQPRRRSVLYFAGGVELAFPLDIFFQHGIK